MAEFYFSLQGVQRLLGKDATVDAMSVDFSSELYAAFPDRKPSR